jgi:hypothetical protein
MNARPATADDYRPDVQPQPIPVHVTGSDVQLGAAAAAGPKVRSVYRTIHLTKDDACQEIMAASDDRICAYVVAIDADVYLSDNKGDAQAGTGSYIPCVIPAATKPNLAAPYPVYDNRVVYAAAAVTPTGSNVVRVSVTAVYRD